MSGGLDRLVAAAVADLAGRTGMDPSEVAVVSAEAVVWPDTALGCPQPGMRYAQVPQDGARVVLEAAGRVYRYHTGGRRTVPFLCEQAAGGGDGSRGKRPGLRGRGPGTLGSGRT